jgi:uncharacterized protein (DUF1778 family)
MFAIIAQMSETSPPKNIRQAIDFQEKLILSNRDRDLFMSVMENPPELKGKLQATLQKFRDKYGK